MRTPARATAGTTACAAPRTAGIAGIGCHLPARRITNADLERIVRTSDEWIVSRTGIRSRRSACPAEAASDLALPAARAALEDAGLSASDIDLIVVATSTPDTPVPSTACWLQARLGASAPALDIGAACAGFSYGLHVASSIVRSGTHDRVLVVGAEALTRFTDYLDRESCVLFGDAAGAAVVCEGGPARVVYSSVGADGAHAGLIRVEAGGSRAPATAATVASRGHFIKLRGAEVFRLAVRTMAAEAGRALAALSLTPGEVDWVVPHQANARIVAAVADATGIDPARVVCDLEDTGNTSAASLPVALCRLRGTGQLLPGQTVLLVAFGAGATWGCQVLEWGLGRDPRPGEPRPTRDAAP